MNFDLTNYSLEVIYLILKKLVTKELIKLRLVNKYLKSIIDNYEPLWRRINLKIQIKNDTLNEFNCYLNLFESNELLNKIEITFEDEIKSDKTRPYNFNHHSIDLTLNRLNIKSTHVIKIFSNICKSLIINGFTIIERDYDLSNDLKVDLPSLKILKISFQTFNKERKFLELDTLSWNKVYIPLLNSFKFDCLNELYLVSYTGSIKKLLNCLNGLNLSTLDLYFCLTNDEFNDKEISKFTTKNITFNYCSVKLIHSILLNGTCLNELTRLSICETRFTASQEDLDKCKSLFRNIHEKSTKIKSIETDLCSMGFIQPIDFKLPKMLNYLKLTLPFNMNRFENFLRNYLIPNELNYLEQIDASLYIRCSALEEEYLLLCLLKLLKEKFPSLSLASFKIVCYKHNFGHSCEKFAFNDKECIFKNKYGLEYNKVKKFNLKELIGHTDQKLEILFNMDCY